MNRIDRLTSIIIYLQGRKRTTVEQLSDRYEISERTVFRDLKALEEAGVPIGSEAGSGYFIVRGYHIPPVMFSKSEAASLLAGERIMQQWSNMELGRAYNSALEKIRSVLPTDDKEYFESMDKHIQSYPYSDSKNPVPNEQIFNALQQSIFNKEIIQLVYARPYKDEQTKRKVEPLGLLIMGRHWYLAAWCQLRKGYRLFRLDRIISFTLTAIKLSNPPAHTLQDYYDQNLKSERELTEVVLRFKKDNARYVGDQKYNHGWAWEKQVGDFIEMTFLCSSLDYLSYWLLMSKTAVTVVKPKKLHDMMKAHSEDLVKHYGSISESKK